jgi:hypothetical protein
MKLAELNKRISELPIGERFCVDGIDDEIYFAADGIGSTAMRAAVKSMAHFKSYMETPRKETPAMKLGKAIHCLVLEPDAFFYRFVMQPDNLTPGPSTAWKQWKAQQTKTILTQCVAKEASEVASSVIDNVGNFFVGGTPEKSYWLRVSDELVLKARVDYQRGDAIVDLKSTRYDNANQFARAVRYDYLIQDAHYRLVTGLPDFIFVGISKEIPYQPFLVKQCEEVREQAANDLNATIDALSYAIQYSQYPLPPVQLILTHY